MRTNFRHIVTLGMLLASCHLLYAQDSTFNGKTIKWGLVQCIGYAKTNNTEINNLRLSALTSQQQYLLARSARLPNLSASATQNFGHYNKTTGGGANGSSAVDASGNYGLSSQVTLYNGNLIKNTILQANSNLQAANLSIIQQENNITLQITQAYLTVLLDKEIIVFQSDLANTAAAQLKLEQQKYNVGSVAKYALVQLQAQQATDQYTLTSEQNTEKGDLLTLKQLLLLPGDVDFDIVKPDTIAPIDSIAAFHDAEQSALNNFPDVKIGELGVKTAQYGVDIARAGYKPMLFAGGTIGTNYVTGQGSVLPGQINNNFLQEIGFTLSVPIFTRRTVKTQAEEAKINVRQTDLNLKNTRIALSQSVERAFLNAQNAKSQYESALQGYTYNKEGYRIAAEQLKVSAITTVDFLVQKNLFIQAQQAFIQARYNELLSLKIYDFYRGLPIKL